MCPAAVDFTPITKGVIGMESGGAALLALLTIGGAGSSMASATLALKIRSRLGQSSPHRWFMAAVFTVLAFYGVAFAAPMFLGLIERV